MEEAKVENQASPGTSTGDLNGADLDTDTPGDSSSRNHVQRGTVLCMPAVVSTENDERHTPFADTSYLLLQSTSSETTHFNLSPFGNTPPVTQDNNIALSTDNNLSYVNTQEQASSLNEQILPVWSNEFADFQQLAYNHPHSTINSSNARNDLMTEYNEQGSINLGLSQPPQSTMWVNHQRPINFSPGGAPQLVGWVNLQGPVNNGFYDTNQPMSWIYPQGPINYVTRPAAYPSTWIYQQGYYEWSGQSSLQFTLAAQQPYVLPYGLMYPVSMSSYYFLGTGGILYLPLETRLYNQLEMLRAREVLERTNNTVSPIRLQGQPLPSNARAPSDFARRHGFRSASVDNSDIERRQAQPNPDGLQEQVREVAQTRPLGNTNFRSLPELNVIGLCPICVSGLNKKVVVSTFCGHLFCRECLEKAVIINGEICPKCRQPLECYHPIYF